VKKQKETSFLPMNIRQILLHQTEFPCSECRELIECHDLIETQKNIHSKTKLILGVFLVRQYNSAPLVGQFGEGA
jgi:hypothetical protein